MFALLRKLSKPRQGIGRPRWAVYSPKRVSRYTASRRESGRARNIISIPSTRNRSIAKTDVLSSWDAFGGVLGGKQPEFDILVGSGLPDKRRIPLEFHKLTAQSAPPSIKVPDIPLNTFNTARLGVGAHVVTSDSSSHRLVFRVPASVLTCVRRKRRREVLLALNRGGSGHRKPHWKDESYIRC